MVDKPKRSKNYDIGRSPVSFEKRDNAGVHLLVDFWFGKNIDDPKRIREILLQAGKVSKSTPLRISTYRFNPYGITGIILLAESHIAIHSWPEINYTGIDIFTCGGKTHPYKALKHLKKEFNPQKIEIKEIKRGIIKNYKKR